MSEVLVETDDYFTGVNPEMIVRSVQGSNTIHADPRTETVFGEMSAAFKDFMSCSAISEPHSKRLEAARMVRGMLCRVIAHRFAMRLMPLVCDLFEGDESALQTVLQDPDFATVQGARAGIRTDFGRVWFGDEARLFLAGCFVTHDVVRRAAQATPDAISVGFWAASQIVQRYGNKLVKHRNIPHKLDELSINTRWSHKPRNHFVLEKEHNKWNEAFLVDAIAAGVTSDVYEFLAHNTESSHEHITSFLSDVMHAFWDHPNATAEDRTRSMVASMHLSSVLAFLANRQSGSEEYGQRYVEDERWPGEGISRRQPLVWIAKDYTIVRRPQTVYASASRSKRNICPGPDALRPLPDEVIESERFRLVLKTILGDHDPTISSRLDRDFSDIDVLTALDIALVRILGRRGVTSFSREDVAAHVRPAGFAPSTGSFILRRD